MIIHKTFESIVNDHFSWPEQFEGQLRIIKDMAALLFVRRHSEESNYFTHYSKSYFDIIKYFVELE